MDYCSNCGNQISDQAVFCSRCGFVVNTNVYNSPLTNNPFTNPPVQNGYATASMVLGILGVVFGAIFYAAIPLNIIGLVFGVKSRKISINGKGTAGLVLSIIGLPLSVFAFIGYLSYYDSLFSIR